jgi:cell division inhibitor SepF
LPEAGEVLLIMAKWDHEEEGSKYSKRGFFEKFLGVFGFEAEDIIEEEEAAALEEPSRKEPKERGKLVTLNQARPVRMLIVEPTSFEEVQGLVDHLKNKRAVIINLEDIDKSLAKRIADFMGGAIYALDGTMQKVSGSIFLFTPQNIEVSAPPKAVFRDKEKEWSNPSGGSAPFMRNDRER